MLISLDWLKNYVDINETIAELDNALTMIGQEVEAIEDKGRYLANVVVGELLEVGKHPEADKLTVCKVNTGKELLQIVCGAKNHKAGDKVAVATEGAVLPGDFKIKKTKLRGVESCGMLCSEKELEISDAHDGIMILPVDAPVGKEIKEYLGISDVIFELEITPNRPDCLSHIGIARELAAFYGRHVKYPVAEITETAEKTEDNIKIEIKAEELCKRYAARVIKGIKVGESPDWLKERLSAVGVRSINNVVDVTNFVLMEYGHPIHAFDLAKIEGGKIVVRVAGKDEKIVTLDDVERTLDENMLVIADEVKPVAIAGVMGGANSEVSIETTDILIEVAYFEPSSIRKTGKKLGLSSEASYRFERGIDIGDAYEVADRTAALIQELAGGAVLSGIVDNYPVKPESRVVTMEVDKLGKFVGKNIPVEKVVSIFELLGQKVTLVNENTVSVVPTTYRTDIKEKNDLYEEVIRMYGFANIEAKMPVAKLVPGKVAKEYINIEKVKTILKETGLQEVINYSFIPENAKTKLGITDEAINLINPINEDMVMMRTTLIHSLLKNIGDNFSRNIFDIKIFEVSRTYAAVGEKLPKEPVKIGIAIGGKENKNLWDAKPVSYDFYDIKGYVEELFAKLGFEKYTLARSTSRIFHPGRSADVCVGRDVVGTFGEIHPDVAENYGLKERVYVAEFSMDSLMKYAKEKINYKRVIKYPAVERDLAIVLKEDVLVGTMIQEIGKIADIIEKVDLFDVYYGEQVEKGHKSVAINMLFRTPERTLTDEDVNGVMAKILKLVQDKFGGVIRS